MRWPYLIGEFSANKCWFVAFGGIKYVHGTIESGRADHARVCLAHGDTSNRFARDCYIVHWQCTCSEVDGSDVAVLKTCMDLSWIQRIGREVLDLVAELERADLFGGSDITDSDVRIIRSTD